ncbi:hypothetical protein PVAG01_08825 [Phlyctema vagabunda]|uniref:Deoxyribonuclease NucA/NucB domain-containing protein n=1 Tax=Phlyctema vagabunda TaxID=108571 RepID=A0ABR4PAI7_9HELO
MKFLLLFSSTLVARYVVASPTNSLDMSLRTRQVPGPSDMMTFLCDEMPDICTNMCYGAICEGIGSTLVYDKADAATKRQRRKSAGCIASGGNRCSVRKGAPAGLQCDEYPFASTADGANGDRLNRCVPAQQNRMQGGTINGFYRGSFCGGGPCTFQINYGNAGLIPYCQNQCPSTQDPDTEIPTRAVPPPGPPADDDDAEDGTDLEDLPPDQEEPEVSKRMTLVAEVFRYRTKLGLEVVVPGGAVIGQRTWWASPRNATLWDEQTKTPDFEDEGVDDGEFDDLVNNLVMNEDFIVERIF